MRTLTYDVVMEVCAKKGYQVSKDETFIVGIRTNQDIPDAFNDYLLVMYRETVYSQFGQATQGKMFGGMATTDPSVYWLNNPMNVKGTAIIVPDIYKNVWKIGYHHGYTALVQCGKFKVWRDSNKDSKLDRSGIVYEAGSECGINCHRAMEGVIVKSIGKFSAGCQVWQNSTLFNKMMEVCKNSGQERFTYILFKEEDFY